jgi:S-adenosylmethionine decarboxylase
MEDFLKKRFSFSEKRNVIHYLISQSPENLTRPETLELNDKSIVQGHHIIANFSVSDTARLKDSLSFRTFMDLLIEEFRLPRIGEVYHDFENGGFTGVVCLTDSHLSIHTFPDKKYLTFDVFLSSYMRDNHATTLAIYQSVRTFFDGSVIFEHKIAH